MLSKERCCLASLAASHSNASTSHLPAVDLQVVLDRGHRDGEQMGRGEEILRISSSRTRGRGYPPVMVRWTVPGHGAPPGWPVLFQRSSNIQQLYTFTRSNVSEVSCPRTQRPWCSWPNGDRTTDPLYHLSQGCLTSLHFTFTFFHLQWLCNGWQCLRWCNSVHWSGWCATMPSKLMHIKENRF